MCIFANTIKTLRFFGYFYKLDQFVIVLPWSSVVLISLLNTTSRKQGAQKTRHFGLFVMD
jgi:hypothetical protein